jgi:hypothetical protein
MFRFLARLFGLVIGVSIVASLASAFAAINFRKEAPPVPDPATDDIDVAAVMTGVEFASSAPSFRGGRAMSWHGGLEVDLRDATIDPAGARLDVRTVFAGTRVVVAPGVPVTVRGPAIFGGVMNSTSASQPTTDVPGLVITGFTVFGGQYTASERGEEIPAWAGEREREHGHGHGHGHQLEDPAPVLDAASDAARA